MNFRINANRWVSRYTAISPNPQYTRVLPAALTTRAAKLAGFSSAATFSRSGMPESNSMGVSYAD
jgi:hypothetical protein